MSTLAFPLAGLLGDGTHILSLSPADGSLLSSDPKIARWMPITATLIVDPSDSLFIFTRIGSLKWLVYDGTSMVEMFRAHSSVKLVSTNTYDITILPNGGWWRSSFDLSFITGIELSPTLSPADGSVLNSDPEIARITRVSASFTINSDDQPYVFAKFGSISWTVYDGAFTDFFKTHSTVSNTGLNYDMNILPNPGWWRSDIEVRFVSGREIV